VLELYKKISGKDLDLNMTEEKETGKGDK